MYWYQFIYFKVLEGKVLYLKYLYFFGRLHCTMKNQRPRGAKRLSMRSSPWQSLIVCQRHNIDDGAVSLHRSVLFSSKPVCDRIFLLCFYFILFYFILDRSASWPACNAGMLIEPIEIAVTTIKIQLWGLFLQPQTMLLRLLQWLLLFAAFQHFAVWFDWLTIRRC